MSPSREQGAAGTVYAGLETAVLHSEALDGERRLWVRNPELEGPAPTFLVLDAEIYLERVRIRRVLRALESRGQLPKTRSVFVSNASPEARHVDYVCNPDYHRFVVDEVVGWMEKRWGTDPGPLLLVGLSLSGLAVMDLAIRSPERFPVVVSQSASLWWRDEHFRAQLPERLAPTPAFWISVGHRETEENVDHTPTGAEMSEAPPGAEISEAPLGLYQAASQIDGCRRAAEALAERGCPTHYRLFEGGHDTTSWRGDLRLALPWAWRRLGG